MGPGSTRFCHLLGEQLVQLLLLYVSNDPVSEGMNRDRQPESTDPAAASHRPHTPEESPALLDEAQWKLIDISLAVGADLASQCRRDDYGSARPLPLSGLTRSLYG